MKVCAMVLWRRISGSVPRGEQGSSATEYAILLGLIVLAISSGAYFLGKAANSAMFHLAGQTAEGPGGSQDPTLRDGGNGQDSGERNGAGAKSQLQQPQGWLGYALAGCTAILLAVGGGVLFYRQGRRSDKPAPIADEPAAELDYNARFFAKREQLMRLFANRPEILLQNQLEAQHLMTTDVVSVPPSASISQMREVMQEQRIRHLLICEAGGELLGVVSDRDLTCPRGCAASSLMRTNIKTVAPNTQIGPSLTMLVNEGISCLPVVENGRLCGILTTVDLILTLQAMLQLWLHAAHMMRSEDWERQFMETIRTEAGALQGDLCRGVQGLWDSLAARGELEGGEGPAEVANLESPVA
jgi:CBS domain-containing protein/Flp pilus assembly pilin Flp